MLTKMLNVIQLHKNESNILSCVSVLVFPMYFNLGQLFFFLQFKYFRSHNKCSIQLCSSLYRLVLCQRKYLSVCHPKCFLQSMGVLSSAWSTVVCCSVYVRWCASKSLWFRFSSKCSNSHFKSIISALWSHLLYLLSAQSEFLYFIVDTEGLNMGYWLLAFDHSGKLVLRTCFSRLMD